MNRIAKISAISLGVLPLGISAAERPNVIFILSDDHTTQAISAYSDMYRAVAPTPNIDRLAKDGAICMNTFCTNPISGPSRATILTGQYSHVNGFYKNEGGAPFDTSNVTFPMLLREAGYTTAIIGKWHLWSEPQGFDYYKYLTDQGEQGFYWNPAWNLNGEKVREQGYVTTLTANSAVDWLDNIRDKSKPFCLLYHFKAPHRSWDRDSCYLDLFNDIEMPYPATFNDDYSTRELTAGKAEMRIDGNLNRNDLKIAPPAGLTGKPLARWLNEGTDGEFITPSDSLKGVELKKWKYQKYVKDYLATVRSVDDRVGDLIDYLKRNGLEKNTIVVYCGDQGFFMGEHGWFDKRFMYDESARMPYIVKYPGTINPGTVVDALMTNADFAPTLLDFCGVKAPQAMQGLSYVKSLKGKKKSAPRQSVYAHYYEYPYWHNVQPYYGVRDARYKLMHYYYDIDVWELFDTKKDPNELKNVYDDPAYAAVRARLHKELERQRKELKDTGTLDNYRDITRINVRPTSK